MSGPGGGAAGGGAAAGGGLASARVVVVAGGGVLGGFPRAVFGLVTDVAHALGGEAGATRAAVDAGVAGRERLVGATGTSIDPDLYLGLGVSGASFHEIGRPVHVLSVNTDPGAPLSLRADLALRTDGAALLTELAARLRDRRPHRGHRPAGGARPRVDPIRPGGTPHERLRMVTGVLPGPVRPAPALGAAAATDALLDFLTRHGYLGDSDR